MTTVSAADIAALREQGDLTEFLRSLTAHTPRATAPTVPAIGSAPEFPRARVGAWPDGCQRPQPAPELPAEEVARAVAEHQQWVTAGRPAGGSTTCGCAPCRLRDGTALDGEGR